MSAMMRCFSARALATSRSLRRSFSEWENVFRFQALKTIEARQKERKEPKPANSKCTYGREHWLGHENLPSRLHHLRRVDEGTWLGNLQDLHPLEPLSRATTCT